RVEVREGAGVRLVEGGADGGGGGAWVGEGDVLGGGEPVEERGALDDVGVAAAEVVQAGAVEGGDVLAVEVDAAGVGAEEADGELAEDGLAAAALADDEGEAGEGDVRGEAAEDGVAAFEGLVDVLEDEGGGHRPSTRKARPTSTSMTRQPRQAATTAWVVARPTAAEPPRAGRARTAATRGM